MPTYENLEIDRVGTDGRVGRITLNRPEKMNSLSQELLFELNDALHDYEADDSCRVIIIRGAGRTFSAGYDLTPARGGADGVVRRYKAVDDKGRRLLMGIRTGMQQITDIQLYFWNMAKVTIAQVHGYALAGGCELAISCDLIVANKDAKFGIPEAKRGLVAAGGGVVQLPRLLPRPLAMEMALTGDPITAQRGYELGLVNRVTDGPAIEAARELARAIAENGPLALIASKGIIRDSWLWAADEVNARQGPYIAQVFASEDAREGATAFAQKRKPNWQGQ
jgi:enoyl-CoA hydratase